MEISSLRHLKKYALTYNYAVELQLRHFPVCGLKLVEFFKMLFLFSEGSEMLRLPLELDMSGPEQRDYNAELGLCIFLCSQFED